MQHQGTQVLATSRLILRPLQMSDAQAMYHNWASDAQVTPFLMWLPHESVAVTQALLQTWIPQYANLDYYQWGITLISAPSEVIGTISVVNQNERIQKMEIGYCLGSTWWGQGVMSEALATVIDFLFVRVGVNRIESRHDVRNFGSGAVMRKCGLVFEGTLRQSDWNNQGVCDAAHYGLLRTDYFATREAEATGCVIAHE